MSKRKKARIRIEARVCGSCTACCTILAVPALGKPAFTSCAHLCDSGCGIYTHRPDSCRTFACAWLRGYPRIDGKPPGPEYRPDKLGAMLWFQSGTALDDLDPAGGLATVTECRKGALRTARAEEMVTALSQDRLVLCRTPDEETLRGPADLLEIAQGRLRK